MPTVRESAVAFFLSSGWAEWDRGVVLRAEIARSHLDEVPAQHGLEIGSLASTEWDEGRMARAIGDLYQEDHPETDASVAAATLARWSADRRFRREGVLLAMKETDLAGMALAFALRDPDHARRSEVLVADVVVAAHHASDDTAIRRTLVAAALRFGRLMGAVRGRMVLSAAQLRYRDCYRDVGFEGETHTVVFVGRMSGSIK